MLAPLRSTVRATIRRRGLFGRGARVLVACSGGPDSVVLTDVLVDLSAELSLSLAVASVDHGLRAESPAEVEHVRALCAGWGVPFHALRLELVRGPGLQARAREARYAALMALRNELSADVLAVGHTRDDQAETVLSRVLRGSGVRGLRGIWPSRPDQVVRPLIDCSRADVLAHLSARGTLADQQGRNVLAAVRDPSNDDPAFERVRLRHETLPALRAEDPEVLRHLAELADDARDLVELAERGGADLLAAALEIVDGQRAVAVAPLRDAPRALRREALRQLLTSAAGGTLHAGRAHLVELEHAVLAGPGAHVLVGRGVSYRREGHLLRELQATGGTEHERGGLRPGSEETTKLCI